MLQSWQVLFVSVIVVSIILFHNSNAYGAISGELYNQYEMKIKALENSTVKPSPYKQIHDRINMYDVVCANGFVLIFKLDANSSACVTQETGHKLVQYNWGVLKQDIADYSSCGGYGFETDHVEATALLRTLPRAQRPWVGIHPGSRSPARCWPTE